MPVLTAIALILLRFSPGKLILLMNMEDSAKSGIHQLIILLMRNLYAVPLYVAAGAGLGGYIAYSTS